MERSLEIGLDSNGYRVTIQATYQNGRLSFMGFAKYHPQCDWSYGGQISESIRNELRSYRKLFIPKAVVIEILAIWDKWHLNDMHAGTEAQEAVLATRKDEFPGYPKSYYEWACEVLKEAELLDDNGYRYGSAWLKREVPADVVSRVEALFCAPELQQVSH